MAIILQMPVLTPEHENDLQQAIRARGFGSGEEANGSRAATSRAIALTGVPDADAMMIIARRPASTRSARGMPSSGHRDDPPPPIVGNGLTSQVDLSQGSGHGSCADESPREA
jgi:hypothetical protein